MASLQITYAELCREVSRFLFGNRTPASEDDTDIDDILRSGMRSFYWPNVGDRRYAWSFLRKVGTITTANATQAYTLAADFGGVLLGLSYASGQSKRTLQRVSEEEIRDLTGMAAATGDPKYFGLRTSQPSPGAKSGWEVLLYPVPTAAYTLSYRYALEPEDLDSTNIYHLGGAVHSETVLEACLAAAEKTLNPEAGPGVHAARFGELLQASVKIDMEMQ